MSQIALSLTSLPQECIEHILSYVTERTDQENVALVCKLFCKIATGTQFLLDLDKARTLQALSKDEFRQTLRTVAANVTGPSIRQFHEAFRRCLPPVIHIYDLKRAEIAFSLLRTQCKTMIDLPRTDFLLRCKYDIFNVIIEKNKANLLHPDHFFVVCADVQEKFSALKEIETTLFKRALQFYQNQRYNSDDAQRTIAGFPDILVNEQHNLVGLINCYFETLEGLTLPYSTNDFLEFAIKIAQLDDLLKNPTITNHPRYPIIKGVLQDCIQSAREQIIWNFAHDFSPFGNFFKTFDSRSKMIKFVCPELNEKDIQSLFMLQIRSIERNVHLAELIKQDSQNKDEFALLEELLKAD